MCYIYAPLIILYIVVLKQQNQNKQQAHMKSTEQEAFKQLNFQAVSRKINTFFERFGIGRIAYRADMKKSRGVPVLTLLLTVFTLPFAKTNLYRHFKDESSEFQKDALYSLLRSPNISWRRFLLNVALIALNFLRSLTEEHRDSVLIVDDSTLARPRAKKVELCSRVFDHTQNKFLKGFRFLCLGWSDGFSFLPLDFALLGSQKPKNIVHNAVNPLDPRTSGAKRRKEATQGAPAVLLQMLALAKKLEFRQATCLLTHGSVLLPSFLKLRSSIRSSQWSKKHQKYSILPKMAPCLSPPYSAL